MKRIRSTLLATALAAGTLGGVVIATGPAAQAAQAEACPPRVAIIGYDFYILGMSINQISNKFDISTAAVRVCLNVFLANQGCGVLD
jgi:hypothetical protein